MVLCHTYSEGRVSQKISLGPRFILCYLENNVSKIPKKLPILCYKIKTTLERDVKNT